MSRKSQKRKHSLEMAEKPPVRRMTGGPAIIARQVTHTETETFSGFLPRPDHLEKYEILLPGFAERLLKQQEIESDHRRSQESKAVEAGIQEMRLRNDSIRFGQRSALWISGGTLLLSGYALSVGAFAAASAIAVSVIGALAAAFIIGGKRVKESEESDSN